MASVTIRTGLQAAASVISGRTVRSAAHSARRTATTWQVPEEEKPV